MEERLFTLTSPLDLKYAKFSIFERLIDDVVGFLKARTCLAVVIGELIGGTASMSCALSHLLFHSHSPP